MPSVFPNDQYFCGWFSRIDWKEHAKKTNGGCIPTTSHESSTSDGRDDTLLHQLHEVIRPFLLRRLKADANLTLPEKREVVLYTGLASLQKKYYKWILSKNVDAMASPSPGPSGGSPGKVPNLANAAMHLRKCCNHPYLFDGAEPLVNGEFALGEHLVENRYVVHGRPLCLP